MIYNVMDYGATGDGVTDDRLAIQAAVDAAHAAGGGTVYIPTGTYIVSGQEDQSLGCVMLYDNITVFGDGMGVTTVKLQDGWNGDITGIFRTPFGVGTHNVTMHDLTIDGNRANTSGKIDGWFNGGAPETPIQDVNITLDHVEVKDCDAYGFDPHEQTVNLTITNCISHGNGLDGFALDYQIDAVISNNIAYGNDRHGFNIVTSSYNMLLTDNIAYGNGGGGIVIQRGSTDIPVPHDITIVGGSIYNNSVDGILVNKADYVMIDGVDVYGNGRRGIRIMGSEGSVVQNSTIHDNSQSKNNGYPEIGIESYDDTNGASGGIYQTTGTQILNNVIYSSGSVRSSYGIRELADGTDYTVVSGNTITGTHNNNPLLHGVNSINQPPDMTYVYGTDDADDIDGLDDRASTIFGMKGHDTLHGGDLNDVLAGGRGNDTIHGEAGSDLFLIDSGSDILHGGDGADTFKFNGGFAAELGQSSVTIADFQTGPDGDRIDISELAMNAPEAQISLVQSGDDTQIFFDRDGSAGSESPVLLATLSGVQAEGFSPSDNLIVSAQSILYAPTTGQSNTKYLSTKTADGDSGIAHLTEGLQDQTGFAQVYTLEQNASNAYINLAVGGSTVDGNMTTSDPTKVWWYPNEGQPGQVLLAAVDLMVKQLAILRMQGAVTPIVIWGQGESEAADIGAIADAAGREAAMQNYMANTRAVFDYIKDHVGQDIQFYIMETGSFNVAGAEAYGQSEYSIYKSVTGLEYIHEGQELLALNYSDVHLAVNYTDLPMRADVTPEEDPEADPTDSWHLASASREIVGDRLADFIALDLGHIHVIDNPGPYPLDVLTDLTIHAGPGLAIDANAQDNIVAGTLGNDILRGWEGDDALVGGGGNDRFYGGSGADAMFGGTGADTFVFEDDALSADMDIVKDFNPEEGDVLDISDLLREYHSLIDDLDDFVSIVGGGNGSIISVDQDGTGTEFGFSPVVLLSGITGIANVSSLVTSGALVLNSFDTPPVAQDDNLFTDEDTVLSGNVLADNGNGPDTDPDDDALVVHAGTFTTQQGGSLILAANGDFTYTPVANFNGEDGFVYTVLDVHGVSTTGTMNFGVASVDDAPVAKNDEFVTEFGQPISGNVLADNGNGADTDPDNDPLTVQEAVFTTEHGGNVTLSADGSFTYTPAPEHFGPDSFSYEVSDGQGMTGTATVNIFVNATPEAADDAFTAAWGNTVSGNVLDDNGNGADADPDMDPLHVVAAPEVTENGFDLSVAQDGSFTYTAPEWFVGTDSFSYTLGDSHAATSSATVTLDIVAPEDAIVGTSKDDEIEGTERFEFIFGLGGNDVINAGGGDDTIFGGPDAGTMAGGTGDDTYVLGNADTIIVENQDEGVDTVRTGTGYALSGHLENLILTGAASVNAAGNDLDNVLSGNAGDNTLDGGDGIDTLSGGEGNDTLQGGADDDVYAFSLGDGQDIVVNSGGMDKIVFDDTVVPFDVAYKYSHSTEPDTADLIISYGLNGDSITVRDFFNQEQPGQIGLVQFHDGTEHDFEFINAAAHIISGLGGDDVLSSFDDDYTVIEGNEGDDTLNGLAGNETYRFSAGDGQDVITDTGGFDRIVFTESVDPSGVSYRQNSAPGSSDLVISYGEGGTITVVDFFGNADRQIESVRFTGGIEHEMAFIGAQARTFTGTESADTLSAFDNGDTVLSGLGGNDTLNGLGGNDTYEFSAGDGQDVISDTGGTDRILFSAGVTAASLKYTHVGNNLVINDTAGGGKITVTGFFSDTQRQIESVQFADGTVHNLNHIVQQAHTLTGTASAETMTGFDYSGNPSDYLYALGGNDTLNSGAGNDLLDGGTGKDTMSGGAGDDSYYVDNTGDVVIENPGGGMDTAYAVFSYTLPANVEYLVLIGTATNKGTGNTLANVIDGSQNLSANNLVGGLGDDTYIIGAGDTMSEAVDAGTDTVIASFSWTLNSNFENLVLTGSAALNGTGNSLVNVITGNAGDNILDGKAGADTTAGGAGNDTYLVDNSNDQIIENLNEGVDSVQSGVSYTLSANIENLTLTKSTAITGIGNAQDNVITGSSADNILNGGGGNDTLIGGTGTDTMSGGAGSDVYYIDRSTDVVIESADEGIDTIYANGSRTLSANVENLVLTGTGTANGTGNELDNSFIGNVMNNILTGHAGNDTLDGGGGNDTLRAGTGNDLYKYASGLIIVDEQGLGGNDTLHVANVSISDISISVSVKNAVIVVNAGTDQITIVNQHSTNMGSRIETITFDDGFSTTLEDHLSWQRGTINGDIIDGTALHDTIIGNAGDDVLNGMGGDDSIHGGAGDDVLYGGSGYDLLLGGEGADTFVFQSATAYDAIDAIRDFDTGENDRIDIADLLTGYDPLQHAIDDFVRITEDGSGNKILSVDADGSGAAQTMTQIGTVSGVAGVMDVDSLIAAGHLIVQS